MSGFGSYPDHFMRSPVFSGLGNIAFKYYMLFQHQSVPEEKAVDEPSWILGEKPGPYITQQSRSLFLSLGKHVSFLGIDCRTERRRDEVLTEATTDLVLERCRKEIIEGETKHLIVLLGVPIAYPRLVWLETVLTSRALDPLKALGRAGVLKSGLLNKFDGGVEILDDLDDHWTAKNHKRERNLLIEDLQDLAAEKSVRITILGGDVHLAAIGQFYSNPKLRIPKDHDHRYMPNIISSAIVNTPPSDMVADVLNKRNKVHHLNSYTDEQMVPLFTHDPQEKRRNNHHLLPKRNWCSIREYLPGSTPPPTPPDTPSEGSEVSDDEYMEEKPRRFSFSREDANPRKLFRRLTSRDAPPTSFRNTGGYQDPRSPIDPDCPVHGQSGETNSQPTLPRSRRQSQDSSFPAQRPASLNNTTAVGVQRRPEFLRRPTNLSERAAKKGNVPGVNPDGTEIDVNDQINLEGGLDIVLNCEVHQGDVSGITTPYRFLVPALWYDGSSDREKFDEANRPQRRPTLLQRFSGGPKNKDLDHPRPYQPEGDTSESEGPDEHEDEPPKKRGIFGLFGRKPRRDDEHDDYDEHDGPQQHPNGQPGPGDQLYDSHNPPPPQYQNQAGNRQSYVIGPQPSRPQPSDHQPVDSPALSLSQRDRAIDPEMDDDDDSLEPPKPKPKRLSKQARLLGLNEDDDAADAAPYPRPGQHPLRGNGILGRNLDDPTSPELGEDEGLAQTSPQHRHHFQQHQSQHQQHFRQHQQHHQQQQQQGGYFGQHHAQGQTRGQHQSQARPSPPQHGQSYESYDGAGDGYAPPNSYRGNGNDRPGKPERRWSLRAMRDRMREGDEVGLEGGG